MTTANTLVSAALKQLRVIRPGATAGTDDLATGLEQLGLMLGAFSAEDLAVPFITWGTFPMTSGTETYTIGATGDVVATRPEHIWRAYIEDDGGLSHFLRVLDERAYMQIRIKGVAGPPSALWYNPTVPNGTLKLYPIPNTGDVLTYSHVAPFTEPALIGDTVTIPRNYDAPVMWNLALWLSGVYGIPPPPVVVAMAEKGKRDLIGLNAMRRQKPAVLDITKSSPLYDLGEGGGDTVSGLILE